MNKFIVALLFSFSMMAAQSASAATLSLTNFFGGSVTTASGSTVSGSATGAPNPLNFNLPVSSWSLTVSDAATVNFDLFGTSTFLSSVTSGTILNFNTSSFSANLAAGSYLVQFLPSPANTPYTFDISTASAVPVPAAIWLFGSAFFGMIGVSRRKS